MKTTRQKIVRAVVLFGLAVLGYAASAHLGTLINRQPSGVVAMWPPSGLMLAVLLLVKKHDWPAILSGAIVASLSCDLISGNTLGFSVWLGLANCGGVAMAAWVVERLAGTPVTLASLRQVAGFVGGAIVLGNSLIALAGAILFHQTRQTPFAATWFLLWIGTGIRMLVVAPVVLTWVASAKEWAAPKRGRILEATILLAALTVGSELILGPRRAWMIDPHLYMIFPFMFWAALRFGPAGAATASLILAALASWNVAMNVGPFTGTTSGTAHQTLQVYVYLVIASLFSMIPAAILSERRGAERRLGESEERYRTVCETATDAIVTIDQEGRILLANPATERIFGYSPQELLGKDLTTLIPESSRGSHSSLGAYLESGKSHRRWRNKVLTGLHQCGEEIPVEVSFGESVKDGRRYFTGIVRDISGRQRAEAEIQESRERYRFLFEGNPLPMWVYDRETLEFLEVNDAAISKYGYSRDDFLRMRITDIRPSEEVPRLLARIRNRGAADPQLLEWHHILRDGTRIEVEVHSRALRLPGHDAVLVVAHDITERRKAQQALRLSESRYREIVENAGHGIYRCTVDGRLLDANPAMVSMLGYTSKEELLEANLRTDIYADPHLRDALVAEVCRDGRVVGREVQWRRRDSRRIDVRLSARAVLATGGTVDQIEGFIEDVTDLHGMAKQIAALQKFEAIGQLAGGIAHDFNNVIGAIMGWAELAAGDVPAGSKAKNRLEKIRNQAQKAANLTRQLLAFARLQILEQRDLDLNLVVREALALLENVIGSHIEVKTRLAPNLSAVRADPSQMEQILMNLVVNARDAMPHGGRLLVETEDVMVDDDFCRVHTWARPGSFVRLSVSDNGEGMDAATLDRIFEPFFTTKEIGKGTGLGLATVYGVVKQHEGFLHVYSEPGHGASFRIYLPACSGAAQEFRKAEILQIPHGMETVLVADDDEGLRELATTVLEDHGYTVLVTTNGEEAVQVFKENQEKVALAVMDVVMPRLTGPDAVAQMLAIKPDLSVIYTTGYAGDMELLKDVNRHSVHLLQKPYGSKALAAKVREILDKRAR